MITAKEQSINGQVTLKHIANSTGVSITTVSRSLRDKPDIGAETKKRIQKVARELGYKPNEIAKSLISGKTYNIGVAIGSVRNPLYGYLSEIIEDEAKRQGYSIVLTSASSTREIEPDVDNLLRKRVDGIILGPIFYNGTFSLLKRMYIERVPFVIFGNIGKFPYDFVTVDREKAVEKAIIHMIETGKRRFSYLCLPNYERSSPTKLKGFEKAIAARGLELREDFNVTGPSTLEDGYKNMKVLLNKKETPDAVFCNNDLAALGAMRAIHEEGFSIPADIAVCGFDNIPESRFFTPSLTTLNQPIDLISTNLVRLIIQRIEKPDRELEQILLDADLIVRESTAGQKLKNKIIGPSSGKLVM